MIHSKDFGSDFAATRYGIAAILERDFENTNGIIEILKGI